MRARTAAEAGEGLGPGQRNLDRAAKLARSSTGQRDMRVRRDLRAKTAADIRRDDADLFDVEAHPFGDDLAGAANPLARLPYGQAVAIPSRHAGVGLHGHVVFARSGIDPFHLDRRGGESGGGIAPLGLDAVDRLWLSAAIRWVEQRLRWC